MTDAIWSPERRGRGIVRPGGGRSFDEGGAGMVFGFAVLLMCQLVGEIASRGLSLMVPGFAPWVDAAFRLARHIASSAASTASSRQRKLGPALGGIDA